MNIKEIENYVNEVKRFKKLDRIILIKKIIIILMVILFFMTCFIDFFVLPVLFAIFAIILLGIIIDDGHF